MPLPLLGSVAAGHRTIRFLFVVILPSVNPECLHGHNATVVCATPPPIRICSIVRGAKSISDGAKHSAEPVSYCKAFSRSELLSLAQGTTMMLCALYSNQCSFIVHANFGRLLVALFLVQCFLFQMTFCSFTSST
jgi:hypothetical protein